MLVSAKLKFFLDVEKEFSMEQVSYEHFSCVEILSGTVIQVEEFPKARQPAYKIWVNFGDKVGIKKTSAQVTVRYKPEELLHKKVMGCVNIGTRNIGGFSSEFLLLGFSDAKKAIILPNLSDEISNGQKLH